MCCRCGCQLLPGPAYRPSTSLALVLAGLLVFVLANVFPVVGLEANGVKTATTLLGTAWQLSQQQMEPVALLVLLTGVLTPGLELLCLLYLLLPLALGHAPRGFARVMRLVRVLHPWGMVEVFLLGVLVSLVKLAHMAEVHPGIGLWSFFALIICWQVMPAVLIRACCGSAIRHAALPGKQCSQPGLWTCHGCGQLCRVGSRWRAAHPAARAAVPAAPAQTAQPAICLGLLLAAMVCYIPANLMPIMLTEMLSGTQRDTIMSGVAYLWRNGSWPLALVVFIASVLVPLLKILSMLLLLLTVHWRSRWAPRQRTRLYRLLEVVGPWSMLDIYVVGLLVALVQLQSLATIKAGPGRLPLVPWWC
jgi:paraquat-inducible protein A